MGTLWLLQKPVSTLHLKLFKLVAVIDPSDEATLKFGLKFSLLTLSL
jgi:hypothetical protein